MSSEVIKKVKKFNKKYEETRQREKSLGAQNKNTKPYKHELGPSFVGTPSHILFF